MQPHKYYIQNILVNIAVGKLNKCVKYKLVLNSLYLKSSKLIEKF